MWTCRARYCCLLSLRSSRADHCLLKPGATFPRAHFTASRNAGPRITSGSWLSNRETDLLDLGDGFCGNAGSGCSRYKVAAIRSVEYEMGKNVVLSLPEPVCAIRCCGHLNISTIRTKQCRSQTMAQLECRIPQTIFYEAVQFCWN